MLRYRKAVLRQECNPVGGTHHTFGGGVPFVAMCRSTCPEKTNTLISIIFYIILYNLLICQLASSTKNNLFILHIILTFNIFL